MNNLTAQIIKRNRMERGVSQDRLARHLGYASGQFVSNFERGTCPLPLKQIKAAADFLKISHKVIIGALIAEYADELKSIFK
jgi:transcriptional regulator with XRE-family HTH domain